MAKNQVPPKGKRAAVYIDGFNLYHPINDNGEPFLKWASLWKLGQIFCRKRQLDLVKVAFCTAVPDHKPDQRDRHNTFNNAQRAQGVTVILGHHLLNADSGKYSEKQSDINVALSLMLDAEDDVFDWAYLLSADSDQAATGRLFAERHQDKALVCVAPPTMTPPTKILPFCFEHFSMNFDQLEECVMPGFVQGRTGLIRRPEQYDPPAGWVHPDQRKKK